jgi:hypothetical protein
VTRRLLPVLLLLAGCAAAPPAPPPPPPRALAPAPLPALPPSDDERLDEAARLLGDGVRLERASLLLASVAPGPPRRELLVGQLAELTGDDTGAVAAYERVLAGGDDDEVRLRRALALERLGRGAEAEADLHRLRAAAPREPEAEAEGRTDRKLRPLRPSSR